MRPLGIEGNYRGKDLEIKLVFGSLEPGEYTIMRFRPMFEKEMALSTTCAITISALDGWREHLHEGLDEFFEQIKKTVIEGVKW